MASEARVWVIGCNLKDGTKNLHMGPTGHETWILSKT
jgi:hypothetical protein